MEPIPKETCALEDVPAPVASTETHNVQTQSQDAPPIVISTENNLSDEADMCNQRVKVLDTRLVAETNSSTPVPGPSLGVSPSPSPWSSPGRSPLRSPDLHSRPTVMDTTPAGSSVTTRIVSSPQPDGGRRFRQFNIKKADTPPKQDTIFPPASPDLSLSRESSVSSRLSRGTDIPKSTTPSTPGDDLDGVMSSSQPIAIPFPSRLMDEHISASLPMGGLPAGSYMSRALAERLPHRSQITNPTLGSKSSINSIYGGEEAMQSKDSLQQSNDSLESSKNSLKMAAKVKRQTEARNRMISFCSTSSHLRINIVTEALSILPSLTSEVSIDNLGTSMGDVEWNTLHELPYPHHDLIDQLEKSTSYQDNIDVADMLDNPAYQDTIQSTDSASSMLRRSMSVPPRYTYKPTKRRDIHEIFEGFLTVEGGLVPSGSLSPQKQQWRETMADILERPDYVDSLESASSRTGLLAARARHLAQKGSLPTPISEEDAGFYPQIVETKKKYMKNLAVLCVSFFFVFTAYLSLRNLQSSLNSKGGLGVIALSSVYAFLFVGCIFATVIVQRLRPKCTMVMCMSCVVIYTLANFYPTFYTLVPACALCGFALSNLWTAHATYLTNIAARYAMLSNEKISDVLTRFNGIFFSCFQTSQILGGVISSILLSPGAPPIPMYNLTTLPVMMQNSTAFPLNHSHIYLANSQFSLPADIRPICGAGYCPGDLSFNLTTNLTATGSLPSKTVVNTLVGVFLACSLLGLLVLVLMLDRLDGVMKRRQENLGRQLSSVFRFFLQWRVVCLLGLMFYTLLQVSFLFGEFTKSFVSCSTGIYMVGYSMLCMSACSAVSSYINSRIIQCVGRPPLFLIAFVLHFGLLSYMTVWQPTPDTYYLLFIVAALWGIGDGIFMTQTISLFGVMFVENKEPAFAALKMCQASCVTIMFAVSDFMCPWHKIAVLGVVLVVAAAGYVTLEVLLRREKLLSKAAVKYFGPTTV